MIPEHWTASRKEVGELQLSLQRQGFDPGPIDGYYGPQTRYAYELSIGEKQPERSECRFDGYGEPAGPQCTKGKVYLPYDMRLAWNTTYTIRRFSCHESAAKSLTEIFKTIHKTYSMNEIREHGFDMFGGCFNHRKKRGGDALSLHSWGVAVDIDPERNRLRWRSDQAYLAKHPEFIAIWERHGWHSLGKLRNYDWMHFQIIKESD